HFHEPLGVVGQIIPWNFPEKLSVWELDGKHGWKSLPDIHSRANNPTSRMMRFAQLSTVKAFSPN
ncbi:aldehyde dehydrogenase family protein, partial [Escherichia coli]|uniref:aldehyde dehydrogenase family protein n=1 Tax=Escherichia coli TaxID=562 RepID=UPI002018E05B